MAAITDAEAISTSAGRNTKLARMASAIPDTRSMSIACRCPLEPTTCVWNVIDSSAIGWKPGYEPYRGNISSTAMRE